VQIEGRIETLERHIEQLEQKLAEDWTDMDVLTAHRAARDELQELLARWETLFEQTQPAS
jgi:BMFP domain-containing protein YqiC